VKSLLILRHAKAASDSPSGSDFDRPLTSHGRRDARAVGGALRAGERQVDAIIASPARRVVETLAAVTEAAGWSEPPLWDRRLYHASVDELIEAIRDLDGAAGTALIAGHNPGLQQLIAHLAGDDRAGLRAQVSGSFPTAALAELELDVGAWRDVGRGCGTIVRLMVGRELDEAPARAG
jgi:phosphohistidine phosphatase